MKINVEELRKKYIANPPEGMTSRDIRNMSDDDLLEMDYFLNDDELDDEFGEEGFYIFKLLAIIVWFVYPHYRDTQTHVREHAFDFGASKSEFPIKQDTGGPARRRPCQIRGDPSAGCSALCPRGR